jgi:hypothetical protein
MLTTPGPKAQGHFLQLFSYTTFQDGTNFIVNSPEELHIMGI